MSLFLGGGGGTMDHGALTGRADDDHLQYHNDERGDARYGKLPRIVTASIVAGTVTVDCADNDNVVVNLSLTANVTNPVVYQNLPTTCLVRWRIKQSGGPWTFPADRHPPGTDVDGDYYIYPDATMTRLWWETFDGGATATLESNAPITSSGGGASSGLVIAEATTLGGSMSCYFVEASTLG